MNFKEYEGFPPDIAAACCEVNMKYCRVLIKPHLYSRVFNIDCRHYVSRALKIFNGLLLCNFFTEKLVN